MQELALQKQLLTNKKKKQKDMLALVGQTIERGKSLHTQKHVPAKAQVVHSLISDKSVRKSKLPASDVIGEGLSVTAAKEVKVRKTEQEDPQLVDLK
jgi:hypothetical protein